jgi:hypothetical protein
LVLVFSLLDKSKDDFVIDFLCLDDETYEIMKSINYKVKAYRECDILKCKKLMWYKHNEKSYYFYSLASYFSNFIMKTTDCKSVMYIDSDILFHKDVYYLYNAFDNKDVGIFRHRFTGDKDFCGEFNVGVVYFKNSEKSRKVLEWWAYAVLYKKYSNQGLDTCGDQKYLNIFPRLLNENELFIDGNIGHGAPWNWVDTDLSNVDKYLIRYNNSEQVLVFTHFSKFKYDFLNDTYDEKFSGYENLTNNNSVYNQTSLKILHDEYFFHLKNINNIINNIKKDKIKLVACIMLSDTESYLHFQDCIRIIYPFMEQIIIIKDNLKINENNSSDELNNMEQINNYNKNTKILIFKEKCDDYISYINKNVDYIWFIDIKEVYTTKNIIKILDELYDKTATFLNITTGIEKSKNNKIFKFTESIYFESNNLISINYPNENPIITKNIIFDHDN